MRAESARVALAVLLTVTACGPRSFFPGARLGGEPATATAADLVAAGSHYGLQVEARGEWLLPSANVRCVTHRGVLYLFTERIMEFGWMRSLRRDPSARLRVGDALYSVRAVPVTDRSEIDPILPALLRKYFAMDVRGARYVGSSERFPGTQIGLEFFRVEPEQSPG